NLRCGCPPRHALQVGAAAVRGAQFVVPVVLAFQRRGRAAPRLDLFLFQSLSESSMRISFQRGMRGFTLIEVAIVAAIVLITAIIGIPAINTYVIENKVPKVGQDLQRFVARVKVASQGLGNTPYAEMNNAQLVSGLRGSSVVSIAGSGAAA